MSDKALSPVVLVVGDMADGFTFYGPVTPNDPQVDEFIDRELHGKTWVYVPLEAVPAGDADLPAKGWEGSILRADVLRTALASVPGSTHVTILTPEWWDNVRAVEFPCNDGLMTLTLVPGSPVDTRQF